MRGIKFCVLAVRKHVLQLILMTWKDITSKYTAFLSALENLLALFESHISQYSFLSAVIHAVDVIKRGELDKDLYAGRLTLEGRRLKAAWDSFCQIVENRRLVFDEYRTYVISTRSTLCSNKSVSVQTIVK